MKQSFYTNPKLQGQPMGALLRRSDAPGLQRFLIIYPLFVLMAVGLVWSWDQSWWWRLPFLLGFGGLVCSLFAMEHETIHNTAFKTRSLNRLVAFLSGMSYGYAPTMFQNFHFAHHRYTHQPGLDPEISIGGRPIPSVVSNLPNYLAWLSGLPFFVFRFFMLLAGALGMPEPLRKAVFPFFKAQDRRQLWIESVVILAFHGIFLYLAWAVDPRFWGWFMGQLVGSAITASYTAAEHNGLDHEGNILERTRSLRAHPLVRWFMWNMPYHAEHHAYPAVPFYALPQLHQHLEEDLVHKDLNHAQFHRQVFYDTTLGTLNQTAD